MEQQHRLPIHLWNLSAGVAATSVLAACGPFVVLEGETDTATVTDTDPPPIETDTTPAVECDEASDCEPGWQCIDAVCVPYGYCGDDGTGGCCYYDCCYGDCYYSECYSDEECGQGGLCETGYGYGYGGSCVWPEELPECEGRPEVIALALPQLVLGEFVSLAFVDANGDAARDLLIARSEGVELHFGGEAAPPQLLPLPHDTQVLDATSGDFDADGIQDLVVSTSAGSLILLDGEQGFLPTLTSATADGPLLQLAAVRWNGDGQLDVAGVTAGQALLYLNDGTGSFPSSSLLPTVGGVVSLAETDYGGDSYDDLLVQDADRAQVFLGDFSGDLTVDAVYPGELHGDRRLMSGPIDGTVTYETIGHTPQAGWLLLELWTNGVEGPQRFALPGDHGAAEAGDYDGDGATDVIARGESVISYVHSSVEDAFFPRFSCRSTYFTGEPDGPIAVGDFDGNGRADVAIDSAGTIWVLLTF